MGLVWIAALVVALMGASPATVVSTPAKTKPALPSIDNPAFQAEVLRTHNDERRALGVPDLGWSNDLAAEAQRWARSLAVADQLGHDSQRRHGESIYMCSIGHLTPTAMIHRWIDEKRLYRPGARHPDESVTGNWVDVGHYTALVWSSTRYVGCAMSRNAMHDFIVCRYDPPGNWRGFAAYDAARAEQLRRAAVAASLKNSAVAMKR